MNKNKCADCEEKDREIKYLRNEVIKQKEAIALQTCIFSVTLAASTKTIIDQLNKSKSKDEK